MQKIITLLTFCLCLSSCDDGDIITVTLDFDETFYTCGELVFYKTKDEPAESLSLQITSPALTIDDILETDGNGMLVTPEIIITIDGTTNLFNYRSYNAPPDNLFCNDVPPSGIEIISDETSLSGTALITTVLIEDDNDGILAEFEDENLDGDNDPSTNPTDTDGDSIPDYLDADDDGDNVLTSTEIIDENLDEDNDPLTNPKDTDNDGIPNYLDTDDDNDGVLTRDEENITQDQNPNNDFTNPEVADYLNDEVVNTIPATAYRLHIITQDFEVNILINNLQFSNITQTEFDFGVLQDSRTSDARILLPDF